VSPVEEVGSLRNRLRQLRAPLASREFAIVLSAQILSELGDWAARVALAVLVLDRTDSAALTALVVTFSVLPWVGIGQFLATFGDRLPRRQLMIACDLIRAGAFLALVIPMPIWAVLTLTFIAGIPSPPFAASRAALLPETVPGNQYPDALALSQIASQSMLALGYLAGGVLVYAIGARGALLVNSMSFVASALILSLLRAGRTPANLGTRIGVRVGAHALWSDLMIRRAVFLVALASGSGMVPESQVAVYALRHLGTGESGPGVLAAAVPVGTILISSIVPFHGSARSLLRIAGTVAASGAAIALVVIGVDASMPAILIGFLGVGVIFGTLIPTNTVFGTRIPNETRASAFGLAQGILYFAQGAGAAAGGVIASIWDVRTACMVAMTIAFASGLFYAVSVPAEPAPVSSNGERRPPAPPPQPTAIADAFERTPPAPPPRPVEAG
jgi:MFS family permease